VAAFDAGEEGEFDGGGLGTGEPPEVGRRRASAGSGGGQRGQHGVEPETEGEGDQEFREGTRKTLAWSVWPEEVEVGRNLRRSAAAVAKKRRPCRQHGAR
jgi:hypothetical protein